MKTSLLALLLLVTLLAVSAVPAHAVAPSHGVAQAPTPVLNTPDFPDVFSGRRPLDPCAGVRPIEFIALPGTLFKIEGMRRVGGVLIYRVSSNDYPYPTKTGYWVDSRFLRLVGPTAPERERHLPPLAEVQQRLLATLGKPYVWGGNVPEGVGLVGELYPRGETLAGVDCSGLLYQATDGSTPRNTSSLIEFGTAVPVAGLSAEKIAQKIQPLDLIVWKGHVMVVLDRERIIQSTMGCQGGGGVKVSPLAETLH